MSGSQKLVAVFGATGQQGGAVVRALLQSNEFRVRGITRNPQSEAANKLLAQHKAGKAGQLELVAGDLDDAKSVLNALTGAWGAFMVTQFWDPKVGSSEEKLAKDTADIALKAGVKFFVFSSLPDAHAISGGRNHLHHFTGKNKAEQYIRTLPFPEGSAFPNAGCFASNFLSMMGPKKSEKDGVYEFMNIVRSDVALPIVDVEEEFGPAVAEIFRQPKKYNGQSVFTGSYYTFPQWAEAFTSATGKPSRYVQLPLAAGKNFGEEMYDMLTYFSNFGYYGGVSINHIVKPTNGIAFWKRHAQQF